jgi:hypothetical protein
MLTAFQELSAAKEFEFGARLGISRTIAFKADPNSSCELLYALSMPC